MGRIHMETKIEIRKSMYKEELVLHSTAYISPYFVAGNPRLCKMKVGRGRN